jgi:hypothetical protein
MEYLMISPLDKFTKSLDLTLTLEIPLAPSGLPSCSPNISVELDSTRLPTLERAPSILPPSPSDLAGIGSSDSLPTILGQETSESG